MKDPHTIIIRPHITERSVELSRGSDAQALARKYQELKKSTGKRPGKVEVTDADLVRKYVFIVATDANKLEIKSAIEAIYNAGKKKDQEITVTSVRTLRVPSKMKRRGLRSSGLTSQRKKAIVTLAQGQILEDYGV